MLKRRILHLHSICLAALISIILPKIISNAADFAQLSPKIDSSLINLMNSSNSTEMIPVELSVSGGISAKYLNQYLDSTCATLDERRLRGNLLLREVAGRTQKEILSRLNELERVGKASDIKSHWLTNTISAKLVASIIDSVARRDDILEVFQKPVLKQIEDIDTPEPQSIRNCATPGVEENLKLIGADSTWRMGYTGKGRLVCIFDYDGVDGKHPSLVDNWKGSKGDTSGTWMGKWTTDGFPSADDSRFYHGTHVLGIMVGHDDVTGDTIGVAPGAQWIGASGPAWEFAADPDGNPFTTDDIPDVINMSFGTSGYCWNRFWDMIDMTEALGIVNIISAGNRGGPYTVESPGNRALDSLTNFAVGAVDHLTSNICWFSSRGPSSCDSVSIKPNVCAPGMSIRSAVPDGGYDYHGGTSMSTPHVAAAVAILRQCAPNASVREIKEALLAGCTHRGSPYPNNAYGWGIINIPASIEFLKSRAMPDLRVEDINYEHIKVQDTLRLELTLKNRGVFLDSVYIKFGPDHSGMTVLVDSIYYGAIDLDQTAVGNAPLKALFDDTIYAGAIISAGYTIHGTNNYIRGGSLSIQAGREGKKSLYSHKNSVLNFTVSNIGQYSDFRWGDSSRNSIYEASLMIGADTFQVSNNFRDDESEPDDDFWFDESDSMVIANDGDYASQETSCHFDDGKAENRIGIQIQQETFSWNEPPNDKYVLLEYVFQNVSSRAIDKILVGLALDWDCRGYNYDYNCEMNFSAAENLGFIFKHVSESDSGWFRAMAVLNDEGIVSYQIIPQTLDGYTRGPALSDSAKYIGLSAGITDSGIIAGGHETLVHVLSTGPFTLFPGQSDTAYFAIMGADSLSELKATAIQARKKVQFFRRQANLPDGITLSQNYPNPFNSSTRIEFTTHKAQKIGVKIFNVLGQEVRHFEDIFVSSGYHSMTWDGTDDGGNEVASGVYFYWLSSDNSSETRKMILLK